MAQDLRKRTPKNADSVPSKTASVQSTLKPSSPSLRYPTSRKAPRPDGSFQLAPNPQDTSYWLTPLLLLRFMAFIYFIAFAVALNQNHALIGTKGIYPFDKYMKNLSSRLRPPNDPFTTAPTFLWFMPKTNRSLDNIAG